MKIVIKGLPISGSQRGKKIGFPTVNLAAPKKISKQDWGVYFSYIYFDGKKLPSVSHLGPIITFNEKEIKCETHIISWRHDIHPQQVKVKLFKKIRDIKKFKNSQELKKQITDDITRARRYFGL